MVKTDSGMTRARCQKDGVRKMELGRGALNGGRAHDVSDPDVSDFLLNRRLPQMQFCNSGLYACSLLRCLLTFIST